MTTNNTKHNCSKPYMLSMKTIVITFSFSMLAIILKYENFLDADAAIWSFYSEQALNKILSVILVPLIISLILINSCENDDTKEYKGIKLSEFLIATSLAICLTSMVVGLDQTLNPETEITMEQFLKSEVTSNQSPFTEVEAIKILKAKIKQIQQPTEDSHDRT